MACMHSFKLINYHSIVVLVVCCLFGQVSMSSAYFNVSIFAQSCLIGLKSVFWLDMMPFFGRTGCALWVNCHAESWSFFSSEALSQHCYYSILQLHAIPSALRVRGTTTLNTPSGYIGAIWPRKRVMECFLWGYGLCNGLSEAQVNWLGMSWTAEWRQSSQRVLWELLQDCWRNISRDKLITCFPQYFTGVSCFSFSSNCTGNKQKYKYNIYLRSLIIIHDCLTSYLVQVIANNFPWQFVFCNSRCLLLVIFISYDL